MSRVRSITDTQSEEDLHDQQHPRHLGPGRKERLHPGQSEQPPGPGHQEVHPLQRGPGKICHNPTPRRVPPHHHQQHECHQELGGD